MKITRDFSNILLKRREVKIVFSDSSNPGFTKAKKEIAQLFKIDEEVVAVKSVKSSFGSNEFVVSAFIYDNLASKEAIEPKEEEKKKTGGEL